jgi:hypothetical protein
MKFDYNAASLALCHAKAIILLLDRTSDDTTISDTPSAAMHFIDDAKAMIDGEDRRTADTQRSVLDGP